MIDGDTRSLDYGVYRYACAQVHRISSYLKPFGVVYNLHEDYFPLSFGKVARPQVVDLRALERGPHPVQNAFTTCVLTRKKAQIPALEPCTLSTLLGSL